MISPLTVLREAIKAVPAVRYALGIGGVMAVVALTFILHINLTTAFFGVVLLLLLMGVLVIFARMSALSNRRLALPALVFTWFTLLIFMALAVTLFTSVFFQTPRDLASWLKEESQPSSEVILDGTPTKIYYTYEDEIKENAIGWMYQSGIHVKQDYAKAAYWYQKGVELDDPNSMVNLAYLIDKALGVTQDKEKVTELALRAGRLGNPRGLYATGIYYRDNRNFKKAMKYLLEAGEKGLPIAYAAIALMYEDGNFGKEKAGEALKWYSKGVDGGDPPSMHMLGLALFEGTLGPSDPARAIELLEKAASIEDYDQGPTVMWVLGGFYSTPKSPVYDPVRAKTMYGMAAKRGHPCARADSAALLLKERPPNVEEAIRLFETGVHDKQPDVILAYAKRLLDGEGLSKDVQRAESLLKIGVELKDVDSMLLLADAYSTGKFGKSDSLEAAKYFSLAAQNGSTDAVAGLKRIISGGHSCSAG